MNTISDYDVAATMQRLGGSFVSQLGIAWMLADGINQDKLKDAFRDYWNEYTELAAMLRKRRAEPTRA